MNLVSLPPEQRSLLTFLLPECRPTKTTNIFNECLKKSHIRETKNLSTDADSRTDTILERLEGETCQRG